MAAIFAGLRPHRAVPQNAGLKPCRHSCGVVLLLALLVFVPSLAAQEHAAPPAPAPPAADHTPAADNTSARSQDSHAPAGEAHEESIWPQVGKLVNFAILIGTVIYFGRKPLAGYLASRRAQVRSDLVAAEEMKRIAAAQIVELDAKLQALPAELDALKARGQQEIAAEEQRIRELAETERARLLEQASREIAQRTRVARRELVEHAASLAVGVAETKIKAQINDTDQARLVDRYLTEVKSHE
jgi:F-type H+-transporting ATPase subunit b